MKKIAMIALIAVFLIVSMLSNIGTADAATSRVAIISKIDGTVEVQKSGGKKTLKGFKGMSLNQGDVVSTGKKSMVELKFSNGTSEDDTFVLESGTTVTFSKVSNKNGTTTKVSMQKGKAWVDVKSIKNKDDEFVLETPTAIMGVRGTNFFLGVDPNTGAPALAVLSGIVEANSTSGANQSQGQFVYPASALTLNSDQQLFSLPINNDILSQMIASTSSEVIAAILNSNQKIIDENNDFLNKLKEMQLPIEINGLSLTEDQYMDNVNNLLVALINEAKKQGKATDGQLSSLINALPGNLLPNNELHGNNGSIELGFELNQLTKKQQLEKQLAEKAKAEALLKGFLAEEQKKKEEALNQKRLEELEQKWLSQLSQAEREKYEQDKKKREEELLGNPTEPASNNGSTPPSITWESITRPFQLKLSKDDNLTTVDYVRSSLTQFMLHEPISVTDRMYLEFTNMNSSIDITSIRLNGEELYEDNGIYRWNLENISNEMMFTITVNHSSLGVKEFTLMLSTQQTEDPEQPVDPEITWESVSRPFQLKLSKDDNLTTVDYVRSSLTQFMLDEPIGVTDSMYLEFTNMDSSLDITSIRLNGEELYEDNGIYRWNLENVSNEMTFTITVNHSSLGVKEFTLMLITQQTEPRYNLINIYQGVSGQDHSDNILLDYYITDPEDEYNGKIVMNSLELVGQIDNNPYLRLEDGQDYYGAQLYRYIDGEWMPIEKTDLGQYIIDLSPSMEMTRYKYVIYWDGEQFDSYLIDLPDMRWQ